jgi:molybdenum cofactor guanylyltransferase
VVACDMPFLSRPLLRYQLLLARDYDAVVPRVGEFLEPLHAVYSQACLEPARALIDHSPHRRVVDILDLVRVRYLEEQEIRMLDPLGLTFMNVNTPEDLARVRRLAAEQVAQGSGPA